MAGQHELPGTGSAEAQGRIPSDAATEAEARLYDVELHDVDDPGFHLRWGGRHAAATLAALRRAHRTSGPIRQVEWGSYEAVLDGAATRQLLSAVLSIEAWRDQPVEIVQHPNPAGRQVVRAGGQGSTIALSTALELLQDGRRYSVVADVY